MKETAHLPVKRISEYYLIQGLHFLCGGFGIEALDRIKYICTILIAVNQGCDFMIKPFRYRHAVFRHLQSDSLCSYYIRSFEFAVAKILGKGSNRSVIILSAKRCAGQNISNILFVKTRIQSAQKHCNFNARRAFIYMRLIKYNELPAISVYGAEEHTITGSDHKILKHCIVGYEYVRRSFLHLVAADKLVAQRFLIVIQIFVIC